jgi:excisionase family DNA binding protein
MQTAQAPAHPRDPVAAPPADREIIAALQRLLTDESAAGVRIAKDGAESLAMPPSVLGILRRVVDLLSRDRAVIVESVGKELSISEAAEILGFSRAYLVQLLDEGAMPYSEVGGARRIGLDDVLAYASAFRDRRRAALAELVRLSEEMALYDLDFPPEETVDENEPDGNTCRNE